jgi:hypothetical protein
VNLPENENTKRVYHTEHFFVVLSDYGWKLYLKCPFCRMARPCGEFFLSEEKAVSQMELYERTFNEDLPTWEKVCKHCHR